MDARLGIFRDLEMGTTSTSEGVNTHRVYVPPQTQGQGRGPPTQLLTKAARVRETKLKDKRPGRRSEDSESKACERLPSAPSGLGGAIANREGAASSGRGAGF